MNWIGAPARVRGRQDHHAQGPSPVRGAEVGVADEIRGAAMVEQTVRGTTPVSDSLDARDPDPAAAQARANGLFAEFPPFRIWIVTPRVSCPPGTYLAAGTKAGNGSSDWCWMVWDLTAPPSPTRVDWLRRET